MDILESLGNAKGLSNSTPGHRVQLLSSSKINDFVSMVLKVQ
jgi:hypothetical protein